MSEPKATLYCVCKKARTDVCENCPKLKKQRPDKRMNWPNWERNLSDIN